MSLELNIRKAAKEWAQRGALRVTNRIRDYYLTGAALKRRTGTAARSVTWDVLPDGSGFRFGTTLKYLIAWENGIRAHQVVAKNAQALRFKIGNKVLYRKSVSIPAQAARPSFGPALDDSTPYLQKTAQKLIYEAILTSLPDRKIVL